MTLKFIKTDACILKHTNLRKLKPILSYPIIYSDKMIPYQLSVITLESFCDFYSNLSVINRQKWAYATFIKS